MNISIRYFESDLRWNSPETCPLCPLGTFCWEQNLFLSRPSSTGPGERTCSGCTWTRPWSGWPPSATQTSVELQDRRVCKWDFIISIYLRFGQSGFSQNYFITLKCMFSFSQIWNYSDLLVLFILSYSSEEVWKLLVMIIRNGPLCTVANDQCPVMFWHSCYGLHCVGTGRTFKQKVKMYINVIESS